MTHRWRRLLLALLWLAALAGAALISISITRGKWLTAMAAAGLLIGALTALAGRTWGIFLVLASAVAIGAAAALGIAPWWFWIASVAGLMPAIATGPALRRADPAAALALALVAVAAGGLSSGATAAGWVHPELVPPAAPPLTVVKGAAPKTPPAEPAVAATVAARRLCRPWRLDR